MSEGPDLYRGGCTKGAPAVPIKSVGAHLAGAAQTCKPFTLIQRVKNEKPSSFYEFLPPTCKIRREPAA
ncbi:hypothetical protein ACMG4P_11515 [Pseudovibrio denitrificans]|uniref:hypothetical protein n=1 Tax=Pseudovibrio denitrificans TaxID=258256 RepID=UPI0039BF4AEF